MSYDIATLIFVLKMAELNNEEKTNVNSAATYMTEKQTILLHMEIVPPLL